VSALQQLLTDAVATGDAPFLAAAVLDRDGVRWQGSAGEARSGVPVADDTVYRIFSMTKAVGSLAAMILVDRGLLTPETTVESVLPEFSRVQVLESISPSGATFRPPARPVTLRHLMTHTSGLGYDTWCANQLAYQEITGAPHVMAGTRESLYYPLQFDPGEGWVYGIGLDWTGQMIERVDGRRIDQFCQEEIFGPLGMTDTTFTLGDRADRLCEIYIRDAEGALSPMSGDADASSADETAPTEEPEFFGLGGSLFGTTPDFIRLCQLVLAGGTLDGVRIIGPETMPLLLENQMGEASVPRMVSVVRWLSNDVEFFPGTRKTHTLGFMRNEEDIPGMRRAGSLTWAGGANTHYWIDPRSGIAAVLMSQFFPFCDERYLSVYEAFERGVYSEFGA